MILKMDDFESLVQASSLAKRVKQAKRFPTAVMLHVLYRRGYRGQLEKVGENNAAESGDSGQED